jgi:ABC-type bacteriocin/lantibiotic exporter with double-glycine peptidase domain
MTAIAISHRQPVLDHCDRVVRLDGGRIVRDIVKEARLFAP